MKILTNSKVNELLKRIAANHIIALDALRRTKYDDVVKFTQSAEKLSDNTIECASILGGIYGVERIDKIISDYTED